VTDREGDDQHQDAVREEFTHQAAGFGKAAVMTSAATLGTLVELVPPDADAHWLEVACGTGVISRAIAARVSSIIGVDLTPAMLEQAKAVATEEGLGGVEFALGDATALEFDDNSFDGAVTRLSLHHIPAPGRVMAEMARVVRPGGWVVVSDIAADEDGEAAAWREEIERLRDPSHWACQAPARLRRMGETAGLKLDLEKLVPIELDFDDWLARGSGGANAGDVIAQLLREQPPAAESFRVTEAPEGRRLHQRYWLARWRIPA
jgi:SAM-dependent methyltransferase